MKTLDSFILFSLVDRVCKGGDGLLLSFDASASKLGLDFSLRRGVQATAVGKFSSLADQRWFQP